MSEALQILRDKIDLLTVPQTVDIVQEVDGARHVTKAKADSLISQLRTAIASSVAASGRGSSLPSERNVINADAIETYERIEIGAANLLNSFEVVVPHLTPEENIRKASVHIYKRFLDGSFSDTQIQGTSIMLNKWVAAINNLLNPPITLEVMGECPKCFETHAKVNDNLSGRALIVEWHSADNAYVNALSNCVARCRACNEVWLGDLQLRELAYELDMKEMVTS